MKEYFNIFEYKPRDTKEAQYGQYEMANGYAKGYHEGLREGFTKARYPEICHCSICHSHGEMCRHINHCKY